MAKFSTIILAAGVGSRMKSHKPKVLHSICGKSMIARITEAALLVSDDVHIVLYHQKESIEAHLRQYFGAKLEFITLHTQDCENFPGTGGALMDSGLASRGQMFRVKYPRTLVLNGDMPLISPESMRAIVTTNAPIVLSTITLENPSGYGRVVLESTSSHTPKVLKIVEEKDCNEQERDITLVNAGIYAFDTELLASTLPKLNNDNAQREYYLTDVIALAREDLAKESQVPLITAFYGDAREFMGVNSKSELAQAEAIRLQTLRQRAMDQGVIMRLPESIYLEEWVEFEGECEIENNVRICGISVIKHSHIKAGSVVEHSVIEHSDIGPMAHIRPHSHISHTHIGNFVETKSVHLDGVKAGHLSYLGDCEIGSGSNVGAGVITCNYDGKQKHRTIIGQNVFIGSDTQLVAPVEIESNSIIGAGSTITANVKSGALALSRAKQTHIAGFFHRFFAKPQDSTH